jgi:DNA replication protein DnaC
MGIVGGVGVGKTWALAQHAADYVDAIVRASPDPDTAVMPYRGRLTWVNWPERAEEVKRLVIKRGTDLEDWIERCKDSTRLYMDDLGRERMAVKGEDDYAQAVLGEILDHRYRYALPVFWSSNLTNRQEFADTYNARLVSRLLGTWAPVLIKGHDIRMDEPAKASDFRRAAGGDN